LEESIAKEGKIPENISELILGEENAHYYQRWLERNSIWESSPHSGGFSVDQEIIEGVDDNLNASEPSILPFFSEDKD
jgi:hypothetical protein